MYKIIRYRLDLGSHERERLNTGIIIAMISYSSGYLQAADEDQWSTAAMAR